MKKNEIINIINQQVDAKVKDLSHWQNVKWQGGRLYHEETKIMNEISGYDTKMQILYLETLLSKKFTIQDNLPHTAPDITPQLKNWIIAQLSQLKLVKKGKHGASDETYTFIQRVGNFMGKHLSEIAVGIIAGVIVGFILHRLHWV